MATVIKTIEDFFHNKVYPKTKTKAVYDDNNNRLDNILASKQDINSNFVYKGTGSATPSIDDPELRQSDISTTQSTSDITVPSSSLVKTMNDNLGNPSSASSVTGADAFSKISTLNSDLASKHGSLDWAHTVSIPVPGNFIPTTDGVAYMYAISASAGRAYVYIFDNHIGRIIDICDVNVPNANSSVAFSCELSKNRSYTCDGLNVTGNASIFVPYT